MKKKLHSRKILSVFLAVAVVIGCLPMALLGASAATVDFVVSDDFTVGGQATVFGESKNRADVWGVYDFSTVITEETTAPVEVDSAYTAVAKTVGDSVADVAAFSANSYALFTSKDYRTTDKVKSMQVDLGNISGNAERGASAAVCVYYDPASGQSLFIAPHTASAYGTQLAIYYVKSGSASRLAQNNNGYNPSNKNTLLVNNPNGLWMRFIADYTYDDSGAVSVITVQFKYYSSNTYDADSLIDASYGSITMRTAATSNSDLGKFFANTGLTAAGAFNAGVLLPNAAYVASNVCLDGFSITYSRELSDEDLTNAANTFVAAHKANLQLTASDINADNAKSVLATVNAYYLLNSEVQNILATIEINGTTVDVGAKITELNAAAAPLVPTENQLAFTAHYTENQIGEKTEVTDADNAVLERALNLYNQIEDTHKANVKDAYAHILDLIKSAYVETTAAAETITMPSLEYPGINAIVRAAADPNAHVTKLTAKINAWDIFNNSGMLELYPLVSGDNKITLSISAGDNGTTNKPATQKGLKILRNFSSPGIVDSMNKFGDNTYYAISGLSKTALVRCFEAWDSYYRLNVTNSNLHRENEGLRKTNEKLVGENENLRAENKDYKLLRKAFGSKQIDSLLEQAKAAQKSKQRGKYLKNSKEER